MVMIAQKILLHYAKNAIKKKQENKEIKIVIRKKLVDFFLFLFYNININKIIIE